jgi:hypothetical protein
VVPAGVRDAAVSGTFREAERATRRANDRGGRAAGYVPYRMRALEAAASAVRAWAGVYRRPRSTRTAGRPRG